MTTLETKVAPAMGEAVDVAVEFRVSRPGLPRRRLRLVGPRYTLGSGPECSVRLEDASLRPLHAVLIREQDRVILRACGAPISINGKAVMEASLRIGDCLQLGEYAFELVAAQTSVTQIAPASGVTPLPQATPKVQVSPAAARPIVVEKQPVSAVENKIVPRRRISFLETAEAIAHEEVSPTPALVESISQPPQVLQQWPHTSAEEDVARESIAWDESAELARLAQLRKSPGTSPDERAAALVDQHRALLANERRWQERSRRQMERFRQREQRSREQIEQLLVVQESADRRARQAEDAVQSLSIQLAELAGQITSLSGTAIPGVEDRLLQHQSDTTIALNNQLGTVETVRERLDQLQLAISDVQSESRLIRQEASANRADQLEAAANADHLESLIRRLSDTCETNRADCDAKYDELRESLFVHSKKIADTNNQLEETRQNNHGLSALVQQLRSSLANLQQESQRFATAEQYLDTQRLLQNGDDRIARLLDDIENQQQQIQQEFESLRLRLDESDESLDRINRAASDALTRAIEAQTMSSRMVPTTTATPSPVDPSPLVPPLVDPSPVDSSPVDSSPAIVSFTDDDPLPSSAAAIDENDEIDEPADDRPLALSDFYTPTDFSPDIPDSDGGMETVSDLLTSVAPVEPESFNAEPFNAEPFNAESFNAESFNAEMYSGEAHGLDWADEPETLEASPVDGVLEDEPPYLGDVPVRNRVQLSGFQHNPLLDETNQDEPEVIVENAANDAELQEVENEMEEYVDGSTYQFNPSASYSPDNDFDQDPASPAEQDSVRGPRSAAEVLASLGLSLGSEDDEVGGDKTEFLPIRDTNGVNSLAVNSLAVNSLAASSLVASSLAASPMNIESSSVGPFGIRATEVPATQPVAKQPPKEEAAEDEDSIEAYMNRLLKRVQGTSEAPKPTTPEPKTLVVEAPTVTRDQTATATTVIQPILPPQPAPDSPYIPRSQAPERTSSMAAMRELANSTARTAIAASAKQRMLNQVIFKFALFVMGMLAGLFTLVGTGFAFDKWMLVAMCCIGLGAFYLMEAMGIRRQLNQIAAAEEEEDEEEALQA